MKKLIYFIFILLFCIALFSCSDNSTSPAPETPEDKEIVGVSFESESFTYDGEEKTLSVVGELPKGVSCEYENAAATNAGTYIAKATLSGEGYKTSVLYAVLTIEKADYDMSGAGWSYEEGLIYDGMRKTVSVTGLPDGVTVKSYTDNEKTDAGSYTAIAELDYDKANYNAPEMPSLNWEIGKGAMSEITVSNKNATYETLDFEHKVQLSGTIPKGSTVTFYYDGKEAEFVSYGGTVKFEAVIENPNYETYTVSDTLDIDIVPPKFNGNISDLVKTKYNDKTISEMYYQIVMQDLGLSEFFKLYPAEHIVGTQNINYMQFTTKINGEVVDFQGSYQEYAASSAYTFFSFMAIYISEDSDRLLVIRDYETDSMKHNTFLITNLALEDFSWLQVDKTSFEQFQEFISDNSLPPCWRGENSYTASFATDDGYFITASFSSKGILSTVYVLPYFEN